MNLTINAAEVRELRKRTGVGVSEARALIVKDRALKALQSPFWFLQIRAILIILVNRMH